jgi:pimeloyl-ACP methyl ester carboxylesterase
VRGGASGNGNRRCLVVFVPGIYATWPQFWEYNDLLTHLDDALGRRFHERHWLPFRYLATFWSPTNPDVIAKRLLDQIEQAVLQTEYDAILFIAHSFGGLMLRRAVLMAKERPWFDKVERIVLLASTSRGLVPATRAQRFLSAIGKSCQSARWGLGRLALTGLKPSSWLDDLSREWRAWLATRDAATLDASTSRPRVIQIQGTRDRVIELADDADLSAYAPFRETVLPDVGHRYFLLKQRWLKTTDPVVARALEATSRALEDAVL